MDRTPKSLAKRFAGAAFALGASAALFGAQGCLDRPVVPIPPGSTGLVFTKIKVTRVDKVDLLLVIDNSISMADKQSELGRRMPELVAALTDPTPDPKTGKPANVLDMHVGVVSSSLGSHGTSACAVEVTNKHNNDRGHLMPRAGEWAAGASGWKVASPTAEPTAAACPAPVTSTALSWVFDGTKPEAATAMFKGEAGAQQLQTATSCVVQSVKDDGCGYEETWEAMYHFLVDPAPYTKAEVKCTFGISGDACGNNKILVEGLDEELIAQRKAFLRADSLLAVVILSDENDFSLKPAGLNWLPWGYGKGQMQRGWGACATVPDDFEPDLPGDFNRLHTEFKCFSCFEDAKDPNCTVKWATDPLNNDVDGRNLRGFNQTQRFGYNFLWGRQRYVDAFTKTSVLGSDNKFAANPIFAGGLRDPNLVVVAAIVGVPGALVTDTATGKPKSLTDADWEKIVGPIGKRDPHMIESIAKRDGVPVFAGDRAIDPVNGGDRDVADGDDLQFACIEQRSLDEKGCYAAGHDCEGADAAKKNPLCGTAQPASCTSPPAGVPQPFFKAYPGLRHLRIVKDLGVSGFVASICAKSYRPAIEGITEKLKAALNAQCLRSSLQQDETGNVNCLLFESMKEGVESGKSCEALGKGLCTPGAEPCRRVGTDYPPITPEAAAAQLNLPITVIGSTSSAPTRPPTARPTRPASTWSASSSSCRAPSSSRASPRRTSRSTRPPAAAGATRRSPTSSASSASRSARRAASGSSAAPSRATAPRSSPSASAAADPLVNRS
ncbi:MAG: hypothetical protein HYV09_29155 [Deltaproteobacteria bacterium]|nr:hypothetical protein [Deltaproteobacteria bacterium]